MSKQSTIILLLLAAVAIALSVWLMAGNREVRIESKPPAHMQQMLQPGTQQGGTPG